MATRSWWRTGVRRRTGRNTPIAAYELALREGTDGVECDVRLTRDGHLVCVHDRRVDRTSTGTGLVSDMTLAELRELDYGRWHSSWRDDGSAGDTGLLTLDALLTLVLDWNRPVKIFIETKHPGALRRAGGEQGAGAAAPLRHRVAGIGGPVAGRRDLVLGGRGLADPPRRADAADGAAR